MIERARKALAFLGGSGLDLSSLDLDRSLGNLADDESLPPTAKYYVPMLISATGDPSLTIRDAGPLIAPAGRFAGAPEQIADEIEKRHATSVDGFNLVPPFTLGWVDEWVDEVVLVLRRRGLMQSSYHPGTLREKLFRDGPELNERHPAHQRHEARAG